MSTTTAALPMLLEEVAVTAVERLSPCFTRVELGSPALADFGVDSGPLFDQRIKLIFPHGDRPLPSFEGADESWMMSWLEREPEERGHKRTYTVREVRGADADTRLVIDFVLHEGETQGPGGDWAARCAEGDRIIVLAPRRGAEFGGIEWSPGDASRLLLVGDETAVPAVAAILRDLPDDARGAAFLEVPSAADALDLLAPPGVQIGWLPREGGPRGAALHAAVLSHLDAAVTSPVVDEVDPDLWETPSYSSSGEDVDNAPVHIGHDLDDLYAWIAGESSVVTGLRRALVRDLGLDRRQVCFMGYWRVGVAMKS